MCSIVCRSRHFCFHTWLNGCNQIAFALNKNHISVTENCQSNFVLKQKTWNVIGVDPGFWSGVQTITGILVREARH